jgi:hypothetical protein
MNRLFPGCLLKCRAIGIIEGEQGKKNKSERNDRIVAIALCARSCESPVRTSTI